jgi:DNA-binding MarR family transcriptional regulator
MSGGPKRIEDREEDAPAARGRVLTPSDEELRWEAAIVVWRRARRFQRRAKQVTRAAGISFARWQVLEVAERLIRHKDDAVSEREVARGAQVAKSTACELMEAMMRQGLVDIQPDAWGFSYRIWLTREGERLVTSLRKELLALAEGLARSAALPQGFEDARVDRG